MVADSKSKSDLSFGKIFASSAFSACFAEVINNTLSGFSVFSFFVSGDSFFYYDLMKGATFMLMAWSSSSNGSDLHPNSGGFLIIEFFFFFSLLLCNKPLVVIHYHAWIHQLSQVSLLDIFNIY